MCHIQSGWQSIWAMLCRYLLSHFLLLEILHHLRFPPVILSHLHGQVPNISSLFVRETKLVVGWSANCRISHKFSSTDGMAIHFMSQTITELKMELFTHCILVNMSIKGLLHSLHHSWGRTAMCSPVEPGFSALRSGPRNPQTSFNKVREIGSSRCHMIETTRARA